MSEFMFVPTILFLTIVAPIWLVLHYRSLNRSSRGLNETDREEVELMLETVDKLVDRIEVLESILEADHPKWTSSRSTSRNASQDRESNYER